MCGIVGVISKEPRQLQYSDLSLFNEMLICGSIRGDDSTGVFSVNEHGNVNFLKLATHPYNLIKSVEYSDWSSAVWSSGRAVIGHNRKATEGTIANKNTHPFIFGNIILIHNGNITNFRSLLHNRDRTKLNVDVDSHAACVLLARGEPEKVIKEMTGAFTFVWYDVLKKSMFFVRNEERPLILANTKEKIYLASEAAMLHWLLERNNVKATITNLKPNVLIQLEFGEHLKWDHKHIELWKPKIVIPTLSNVFPHKVGRLLEHKYNRNNLDIIPENQRYNIHYGGDSLVIEDEIPFQQIIFEVEDYKNVGNQKSIWQLWGKAIDSETITCVCNFTGSDKEVEALAYTPYLIGLVRRVKNTHQKGVDLQEVVVTDVREVDMIKTTNGIPITQSHFNYLKETGSCRCNMSLSQFEDNDLILERDKFTNNFVCDWCVKADAEEKAKQENEIFTTPTV